MKEVITRQTVMDKLRAYLQHELALDDLGSWAETAMMEGEFEADHVGETRDAVAKVRGGRYPRLWPDMGRLRAISRSIRLFGSRPYRSTFFFLVIFFRREMPRIRAPNLPKSAGELKGTLEPFRCRRQKQQRHRALEMRCVATSPAGSQRVLYRDGEAQE
ncbi:MAG: hypothetical protein D6690_13420 [Nitrospirae bacterium]|nr:MAG: hypothetical protein D6690_13420 [Nitrospirota bacterium]